MKEIKLSKAIVIISHTDKKGVITYCNDDFVKVSGYTREELLGKTHNILKHSDMPKEAFADLWKTIKKGIAWKGFVKNRCKNGDYYWVFATVTPTKDGYMSVRYPITDEQKTKAQSLYDEMRTNSNYFIYRGQVFKKGLFSLLKVKLLKARNTSLKTKLLTPIVIMGLILGGNLFYETRLLKNEILEVSGSATATSLIETARNARAFYTQNVLPKTNQTELRITHDFENDPHGIPLPASLMRGLGEMSAGGNIGELRLYSRNPFTFSQNTTLDNFEREALIWLEENPRGSYSEIERINGEIFFRLAQADVMINESCISCHNNHPSSTRNDWQIGDVRGAIAVKIPLANLEQNLESRFLKSSISTSIIGFALLFIITIMVSKLIKRISLVQKASREVAEGDLSKPIKEVYLSDEIGALANSLTIQRNKLAEIAYELKVGGEKSKSVVDEIVSKSDTLCQTAENQKFSSQQIASAIEELSASISELASEGENVLNLSSGAKEVAENSSDMMNKTLDKSKLVSESVEESSLELEKLKNIAGSISTMTTQISEIAEQTNLLALNAAIEAARAGESGRGFAVVADEVRALASKSAKSAEDINSLVGSISRQIDEAVKANKNTIEEVRNSLNTTKETQNAVNDIVGKFRNVMTAMQAIKETLDAQRIASNEVAESSSSVLEDANTVSEEARESAKHTQKILPLVEKFEELSKQFKLFNSK